MEIYRFLIPIKITSPEQEIDGLTREEIERAFQFGDLEYGKYNYQMYATRDGFAYETKHR